MGRFGAFIGRIPGIPTKSSLGRRLIARGYNGLKGEADILGHVKPPKGTWELIPCDHATDLPAEWHDKLPDWYVEDVSEWYIPADGSRPYPADGVGGTPGRLFGTSIAVGYRDFGEIRRLPNTELMRNVHVSGDGHEEIVETPEDGQTLFGRVVTAVRNRFDGLLDAEKRAAWCCRWGFALYRGKKLLGKGYTTDSLRLTQDPDSRWALERLMFDTEINDYESTQTGGIVSASGIGSEPADLFGHPVGYGNVEEPELKAVVTPRLGRNLHRVKLATPTDGAGEITDEVSVGGEFTHNGQQVAADGGVDVDINTPEPKTATARHDDIILEERAFVRPEDTRLLGGNQDLSEKFETAVERAKVSQNMPGDGMMENALRYGGIFMGLIMGWWMGKQSGGGGGGGGGITSGITDTIPGMVMPADVVPQLASASLHVTTFLPGVLG